MFINSIELENFKSFKPHQKIVASPRKNIVIGKNGSGKSNLFSALGNIFLFCKDIKPQYNNNKEPAMISVEIDNSDKRFLLSATFTLKLIYKGTQEFFLDEKPISKEELKGLFENAGFTQESFIMQGKITDIATMNSIQRFSFIARIAGIEKYEDSKSLAIRFLNEDNEERVESLIEKIEMKMRISEDYKRKADEYDGLCKEKAESEFELMNYELKELNEEIDSIVVEEHSKSIESDEGMADYETKDCREEINRIKLEISGAESFVNKFDKSITDQLRAKLEEYNRTTGLHIQEDGNNGWFSINPYIQKVESLKKSRDVAQEAFSSLESEEMAKYIELKALKYFDAMGSSKEDISVLEQQVQEKRNEIENFKDQNRTDGTLREFISKRKQCWIKEKQIKEELQKLKDLERSHENKVLYLGKHSINLFDAIKDRDGVHGTVYSLFDVPENLMDAYESVTRNSLFWIVVSSDDIATKLIGEIDGRVTFAALNRIKAFSKPKLNNDLIIKLSDQIKGDQKYKNLLEMICKDYYVTSDIKNALTLSEKYNINVVTVDGDICNKNGSITGGYERSNLVLRELKTCKIKIKDLEGSLAETTANIEALNEKIKYTEMTNTEDNRIVENLKAVEKYLVMKIQFMKNKKISIPQLCDFEMEYNKVAESLPHQKLVLESIENQLRITAEKKERIDQIIEKIQSIGFSTDRLNQLKMKEQNLIDSIYIKKAGDSLEYESKIQRKHMLIDRRTNLMGKTGLTDFRTLYIDHPKDQLISKLKEINKKLKDYYGFNKRELLDDQRSDLRNRLEELRNSKTKILEFISILDQRKEDTMNLTFSMISDNYSYFYRLMTGDSSAMYLKNDTVDILVNGVLCDVPSMSGGQKTVIALCLIFAIQKNDPSPFYVFDEIDANLDKNYCEKLYEIIHQSSAQYFITSFKEESIGAGDKFFGVVATNKESLVGEIDRDLAIETIKV